VFVAVAVVVLATFVAALNMPRTRVAVPEAAAA
jgi:hypothetical protein